MVSLKDSLFAHYKMNDNAPTAIVVDETGNHHGEYQLGSVAQNTDTGASVGKIFGALDFVGGANGEHIEIPDNVAFSPGNSVPGSGTPLCISAWVYMHDATSFIIASKGASGSEFEWEFKVHEDDLVRFRIYDSSIPAYIGRLYNTVLTSYEDKWTHLVVTYDGGVSSSGVKIFLNGVRIDDTNLEFQTFVAVENLNHAVWIGRYGGKYANGLIDNVMFFNKVLTPLEVKYLYNSGIGRENISVGSELSRTGHRFSSFPEN